MALCSYERYVVTSAMQHFPHMRKFACTLVREVEYGLAQ